MGGDVDGSGSGDGEGNDVMWCCWGDGDFGDE